MSGKFCAPYTKFRIDNITPYLSKLPLIAKFTVVLCYGLDMGLLNALVLKVWWQFIKKLSGAGAQEELRRC